MKLLVSSILILQHKTYVTYVLMSKKTFSLLERVIL